MSGSPIMASFNRVILMGNVTRDPQVRYTTGGMAVTELGLAVNRQWYDKASNQKKEEVTYVDVTLWGRQAEVAGEYLAKGRPVFIEGRLQLDTWDDKETGQKRSKMRVVGETLQLLGSRDGGSAGGRGESSSRGDSGSFEGGRGGRGSSRDGGQPAPSESMGSDYGDFGGGDDDVPF
ncbi:single-strand binding protein [Planctopirus limnophila DSM 3776]|uniref:Single-stranded DNA-binding protein n=2 Tax=Planctopirus limnophila TaxID=120 RepID=D5SQI8_PLAL2|nr:single-strand binding protein [Planctopirus limnophila DSM 3776]